VHEGVIIHYWNEDLSRLKMDDVEDYFRKKAFEKRRIRNDEIDPNLSVTKYSALGHSETDMKLIRSLIQTRPKPHPV